MKPGSRFFFLFLTAGSAPLLAASEPYAAAIKPCPLEFPVEAIKLSPLPKGWIGLAPPKLLLTSADVILGPPTEPGVQIGKRSKTGDGYIVVFDYLYTTSPESVQKWLACRYGHDLAMAERLPDNTDRCVVTYTRDGYNGYSINVTCHVLP
jgi:hypothetical protein